MLDLPSHYIACQCLGQKQCFTEKSLLVKENRISQYMTSTGQNTGRLKISNQLQTKLMVMALVAACQNLNSGSLLMNGLNSSSCLVGRADSPSSSPSSCVKLGSNLGCKNARKRLRR